VPRSLRGVLLHHNVTAYLNGHLHSAFGNKLHRMHRNGATGGLPYAPLSPLIVRQVPQTFSKPAPNLETATQLSSQVQPDKRW